jgi:hypothetical protein
LPGPARDARFRLRSKLDVVGLPCSSRQGSFFKKKKIRMFEITLVEAVLLAALMAIVGLAELRFWLLVSAMEEDFERIMEHGRNRAEAGREFP